MELHQLAHEDAATEKEVLFNALNVYQVTKIEKDKFGVHLIHLRYGVMI